jgi:hypothetical protein
MGLSFADVSDGAVDRIIHILRAGGYKLNG